MRYVAGVELGGTTCTAAISDVANPDVILQLETIPTGNDPSSTMNALVDFLQQLLQKYATERFQAIAIASFGPIDLHEASPTYGHITTTPKHRWRNFDVVGTLARAFPSSPVVFETDVNAPAIAEALEAGDSNVVYVTVGTGVGVGVYVNGSPVHGLLHPEAGHMIIGAMPGDLYAGCCPFHGNCLEGMLNAGALAARAGIEPRDLHTLHDAHWVWDVAGHYLGALCVNLTYTFSPDVIILGGGVMQRSILYKKCRENFKQLNAGYVCIEKLRTEEGLKQYIRGSKYGCNAGIIGALLLAKSAITTGI